MLALRQCSGDRQPTTLNDEIPEEHAVALSAFEKGRLKIAAHVREELELARIEFDSIQCRTDGMQTRPDMARLTITAPGTRASLELLANEVEECESIVAGEVWYKIAGLIRRLRTVDSS